MNVLAPNPVTLTCTAKGEPSPDIVWIKEVNGDQMEYSESQDGLDIVSVQSTNMSSSTLTISSTDALDTANYSCMAENVIDSIRSQPAEVTVFGECIACILSSVGSYHSLPTVVAPSVRATQSQYLAIEFEVQELTCEATGVPAPTITFMRNGVLLDGMGNISFTDGNLTDRVNLRQQTQPTLNSNGSYSVTRTLEMLYPIGQDTGNYTCIATVSIAELNQTLSDEDTFNVIVQSK